MMNLFEETELFNGGVKKYINFQLSDTELRLWQHFFGKSYAEVHPGSSACGRCMIKWLQIHAWTPMLLEIKAAVEKTTKISFDRVLLNLYRDGKDSVAMGACY
jgi:hypothetical protein